jgi:AcrR family transcriptional regulator
MTTELTQLRSDARENRDRIVEVARELFAERGLEIGMREIARTAAVGPATLYRRFPTKQDLVDEAFGVELRACRGIVETASAASSPWRGFASAVRELIALNARNRGFVEAFTATDTAHGVIVAHRRELLGMLAGLTQRAVEAGELRADFRVEDLVLVLRAGRAVSDERAAERFAQIVLDGFRTRS